MKISNIIEHTSLLLLIVAIGGQFYFVGETFDIIYAVGSSAGVSLLLISNSLKRKEWGLIPIAVLFGTVALYFSIDFSILDDFVKTKNSGLIIISTSFLCYLILLFQQLWHK